MDKRYLFFASNGHDGFGDADIYVSERMYDSWDVWSKPLNLGEPINTDGFDAYFWMAPDSTVLFSSNRDGGLSDIYTSKIRKFDLKKRDNFNISSGMLGRKRTLLTEAEIEDIFGISLELKVEFFDDATAQLDRQQTEYLYFVSNKIRGNPDIKIFLDTKWKGSEALNQKRVFNIRQVFFENGIAASRVLVGGTYNQNAEKDQVLIKLFKN